MRSKAILVLLMSALSATAGADGAYTERAGKPVGNYVDERLNFALGLGSMPYVVVDFSEQIPDASFAAMRFDPLVFTMMVVEDLGLDFDSAQYADIVKTATAARFAGSDVRLTSEIEKIGTVEVDGVEAVQLGFTGDVGGGNGNYVITVFVKGTMAYQMTVFSTSAAAETVRREADALAGAISFPGAAPQAVRTAKPIDAYRSAAFGYTLAADDGTWFPWVDVDKDYPYADIGALGAKGYGAVVMPFCWQGSPPTRLALLDVVLEQYGTEYPAAFISEEKALSHGNATGVELAGEDLVDGARYRYEFRVASNDRCAWSLGTWAPAGAPGARDDLAAFWDALSFDGEPTVFSDAAGPDEKGKNAFFLNQLGMHYFDARGYRDAFRYLSQAADLGPAEPTYLTNALRALSELDAYREALDWLEPRLARYPGDSGVRSWEAWLAYQVDDSGRSIEIYDELFRNGYREDQEFSVYLGMLADRELWDRIDRDFEAYTDGNLTDELRRLKASLLSRRGRHDEALAILDSMTEGRPFDPELAYAKIDVYDAMQDFPAILKLADLLIEKRYESLESWFYRGYAQFSMKSYPQARESFETALRYSPTSAFVREYIDAINGIMGEGDNASISAAIDPVALPDDIAELFDGSAFSDVREGYGAYFINRVTGFDYDGGESVSQSYYQQIKIQDGQGIAQFSTLEFDFDPAYEQLYVNRLVVRDAAGETIAAADRDTFYVTDTTDGFEASTEQTAHLPVPSLAPGVVIDVVVTKRIGVDAGEMPLDIHYLSSTRPIAYSALFVTGDADRYRHAAFGTGQPRRTGRSLVWELTDPVVYRWEPMQPYFDRMLPWVTVGTTSTDWDAAGRAYFAKIEDKLDPERVADTARRLVRGVDDEREKIAVISRYVQKELHYEAIEFGRRAYIPKTPRETLTDRYGDCKDHSVLLYAMLNSVGVPAELALVNINRQVLPDLPDVDQFDHMIVSVPRADGRLFIDATDKDLSLGRTPPRYLAGNSALVIGRNAALVPIPEFSPGDSTLRVEREIERLAGDEIRVMEVGTLTGLQAAELRGQLREIEPTEMLDTMQRWVAERYADAIVDDAFVDNLLEADSELVVELSYRLPIDDGDTFRLPGFFEAEYLEFSRVAERRFGFETPSPLSVSAVTTLVTPPSAKLAMASRKPDAGESRFGNWRHSVDKGDDRWVFRLEYSGGKSAFEAGDYAEFADFHRRLVGSIEQSVIIQ